MPRDRAAFALIEPMIVIAIIGMLIAFLLPAVPQRREAGGAREPPQVDRTGDRELRTGASDPAVQPAWPPARLVVRPDRPLGHDAQSRARAQQSERSPALQVRRLPSQRPSVCVLGRPWRGARQRDRRNRAQPPGGEERRTAGRRIQTKSTTAVTPGNADLSGGRATAVARVSLEVEIRLNRAWRDSSLRSTIWNRKPIMNRLGSM